MSELVFTTFGAVTELDSGRVNIPDDRRADFQRAAAYFSAHTNRARLSVAMPNEDDAKLLAKQIKQWAEDTGRSAAVKRDGTRVEFRFAKKRDTSHAAGPVTVTYATADGRENLKPPAPNSTVSGAEVAVAIASGNVPRMEELADTLAAENSDRMAAQLSDQFNALAGAR